MKMLTILAILSLVTLSCSSKKDPDSANYAHLSIKIEGAQQNDTVMLSFWQHVLSPDFSDGFINPETFKSRVNDSGFFSFEIPMGNQPGYFVIAKDRSAFSGEPVPIMDRYIIEPGDSVTIIIDKRRHVSKSIGWNYSGLNNLYRDFVVRFSGKGYDKYQCRYQIDTTIAKDTLPHYLFNIGSYDYISKNHYVRAHHIADSILSVYRNGISPFAYDVLSADIHASIEIPRLKRFNGVVSRVKSTHDSIYFTKMIRIAHEYFSQNVLRGIPENAVVASNYASKYFLRKAYIMQSINGKAIGEQTCSYLKANYENEVLGKLLTLFLARAYHLKSLDSCLDEALDIVQDNSLRQVLEKIDMTLRKGREAFNFSLPDKHGQVMHLADFHGRIVFMDFWFTGCGWCIKYYKNCLSKVEECFKNDPRVVFISVSVDKDEEVWLNSISSGKYSTTSSKNVVNLYTGGRSSNCEVVEHYNITGYPRPILIDQKGRIFASNSEKMSTSRLLKEQIEALMDE